MKLAVPKPQIVIEHQEGHHCGEGPLQNREGFQPHTGLTSPRDCVPGKSHQTIQQWKSVRTLSAQPSKTEGSWKLRWPLKVLSHRLAHLQTLNLTSGRRDGNLSSARDIPGKSELVALGQGQRNRSHCPCVKPDTCVVYRRTRSFLCWTLPQKAKYENALVW